MNEPSGSTARRRASRSSSSASLAIGGLVFDVIRRGGLHPAERGQVAIPAGVGGKLGIHFRVARNEIGCELLEPGAPVRRDLPPTESVLLVLGQPEFRRVLQAVDRPGFATDADVPGTGRADAG